MMPEQSLLDIFVRFGLSLLLGFLVGLERGKSTKESENEHTGARDFVLFALLGAVSTFAAEVTGSTWIIGAGFLGFLSLLVSGYWASRGHNRKDDPGITTEIAAVLTFLIGVLVMLGHLGISIALTIVMVGVLSQKGTITAIRQRVNETELNAIIKLLVVSFIVLPVLPNKPLDTYFTLPLGTIVGIDAESRQLDIEMDENAVATAGTDLLIYSGEGNSLGEIGVDETEGERLIANYRDELPEDLQVGMKIRAEAGVRVITTLLAAIRPYKVWLIVVLVSSISFVGYVLIKFIGPKAGIGLTGIIGGLASSTVTTLSFAKRSLEAPAWNRNFAIAVILASSVMFPRLIIEIFVVNAALARNMLVPLMAMGLAGISVAALYHFRASSESSSHGELKLENPFSLKSAVQFALVFAAVLMVTRLAITYLGSAWLPVVAIVSGLTDADAIAFSVSDAQRADLVTLDWASFNVVLGALSNTFMKLFLVLGLGHRGLFKNLLAAFLVIGAVGLITMFFYYDLPGLEF